jgi:hypothetical protein
VLQGQPDYALASAGGRVVGHSLLAAEGRPRWATVVQRAARLVPGGLLPFVHPHADEVGSALCCLPPHGNLLARQPHAQSALQSALCGTCCSGVAADAVVPACSSCCLQPWVYQGNAWRSMGAQAMSIFACAPPFSRRCCTDCVQKWFSHQARQKVLCMHLPPSCIRLHI